MELIRASFQVKTIMAAYFSCPWRARSCNVPSGSLKSPRLRCHNRAPQWSPAPCHWTGEWSCPPQSLCHPSNVRDLHQHFMEQNHLVEPNSDSWPTGPWRIKNMVALNHHVWGHCWSSDTCLWGRVLTHRDEERMPGQRVVMVQVDLGNCGEAESEFGNWMAWQGSRVFVHSMAMGVAFKVL